MEDGLLGIWETARHPRVHEERVSARLPSLDRFRWGKEHGAPRQHGKDTHLVLTELYEEAAGAIEASLDKSFINKNSSSQRCLNALKLQHAK